MKRIWGKSLVVRPHLVISLWGLVQPLVGKLRSYKPHSEPKSDSGSFVSDSLQPVD